MSFRQFSLLCVVVRGLNLGASSSPWPLRVNFLHTNWGILTLITEASRSGITRFEVLQAIAQWATQFAVSETAILYAR